ncbi:hypothetical protein STCU_09629 [Strigomonas culicis]|uniref:SET domain-containing protein n=1 Tax=Strigomonas culicis TaxID=28005 RepID=S9TLL9_9TRYP|nr:hypothetical protein STCU_09629 [Strigomonas culicis]|eukprot:EPY19087.1 hypothetical protein STCU_09629 [Strigomonas culicis]
MMKDTESSGAFRDPVVPGFRFLAEEQKQSLYVYADEVVRQRAIADGFVPQQKESGINVRRKKTDTLVAVCAKECRSGDVVFQATGVLLPFPVRSTIELPENQHLRLTGGSEFIRHSCLPNLRLEVQGKEIRGVALRPMEAGELLTYNYLCTEWEISKVFQCSCNKYCCYGLIKGFKFLDREQREHLLPNCTEAIREKCHAPLASAATLNAVQRSNALSVTAEGRILSQKYVAAGTVLLTVSETFAVEGSELVLHRMRLPHSCDASTALVEGRLVTSRPLLTGDVLTFNLNTVCYEGSGAACHCGQGNCAQRVCGFHGLPQEEQHQLWSLASEAVREEAIRHHYEMHSSNPLAVVRRTDAMGEATFARKNIVAGTRIFHVTGLVLPFPTVYTIFIGEARHLLFSTEARCLAHSCQPNTRIVVDAAHGSLDCFATGDIEEGALLSFNYLTTEWDMKEPFQCACGAPQCYGKIKGFAHLCHEDQLRLWNLATKAIQARYATTASTSSVLATLNRDVVAPCGGDGELRVRQELCAGAVLFEAASFQVEGRHVVLGDVRVPHSCAPSAAYLNGRVVLTQAATRDTRVTLNVNELVYQLAAPFDCGCGGADCVDRVGGFAALTAAQQDRALLCTLPSVREEAVAAGYENKSASPLVAVRANGAMGQATFAARDIQAGTRFLRVTGLVLPFPTVYTIMLAPTRHLLFAGGAQCLAHSCDPNVRIMVDRENNTLDCLALRPIRSGELISFNYLCTEWDMDCPFKCVCQAPGCYGKIRGFKHLTNAQRQKLWSTTSPAIRSFFTEDGNWSHLCSSQLRTDAGGRVRAAAQLPEGTPILSSIRREVHAGVLVVDGIQLRHNCAPTAAVVEDAVVLLGLVCEDTEITVDLNCLHYALSSLHVPLRRPRGAAHGQRLRRAAGGGAGGAPHLQRRGRAQRGARGGLPGALHEPARGREGARRHGPGHVCRRGD